MPQHLAASGNCQASFRHPSKGDFRGSHHAYGRVQENHVDMAVREETVDPLNGEMWFRSKSQTVIGCCGSLLDMARVHSPAR